MTKKSGIVVSPHTRIFKEIGEGLIRESLSIIRDFCKFMIGAAFSAIPVFIALLKLVVGDKPLTECLSETQQHVFFASVLLFLISAISAVFGFMPYSGKIHLQLPDSIRNSVQGTIALKKRLAIGSIIAFVAGLLLAIAFVSDALFDLMWFHKPAKPIVLINICQVRGAGHHHY